MVDLSSKASLVVGDRTAKVLFEELGLATVEDILRHYPRRYVVRGQLTDFHSLNDGDEVTILARIASCKVKKIPGRKGGILEVVVSDGSEKLLLTFFNQAWRAKDLREGREGLFAGKVSQYKNQRQLAHPDYLLVPEGEDAQTAADDFAGKYLPVYKATRKLPSWKIAQCVSLALANVGDLEDPLPVQLQSQLDLPSLSKALREVHQPTDLLAAEKAIYRLTFDEALAMQLFLLLRKREIRKNQSKVPTRLNEELLAQFDESLNFKLTAAQLRVWNEIRLDLAGDSPMYRLLQGDVGSGKTIIALRAMLSVENGQSALLAPTEVLAQQHFKTFTQLLGKLANRGALDGPMEGVRIALLTGSTSSADRREILGLAKSGEIDILIGTHSLLNEELKFKNLELVVIDEQHRFGVEQRDVLRSKSEYPPHILVMTATPIPRTVAMTVFGDLDVSTLDELPLGRTPIQTHVVNSLTEPKLMERTWQRVREEISSGHQVYVVVPRISPTDDSDFSNFGLSGDELKRIKRLSGDPELQFSQPASSVSEIFPKLRDEILNGLRIAALHGRLSSDEKESTMRAFQAHEIDVLVSTTVIEVGVDVSNASMMVILDAERFGVSQLHQLRGRVGRGQVPGLCILVTSATPESDAALRLKAVASTTDGFELSRLDLEQRREGDVLGSAQSGATSHLRLLRVIRDESLIIKARQVATELIDSDEALVNYSGLLIEVDKLRQEERASYLEKK
ncbi:MAG: ATP-dependent DNA helicase RecG [Actinomycetales bacterium]|nr:ATP-dependent DNA helicase RecG [Actinomycetales bacterium]